MGQHDHGIEAHRRGGGVEAAGRGLLVRERPADGGRLPEHGEEILGDLGGEDGLGLRAHGEGATHGVVARDAGEALGATPPVGQVAGGDPGPLDAHGDVRVVDLHERGGLGQGEGPDDHRVHHREQRRARADAHADGEHAHREEAGPLPQHAQRVRGVLHHRIEPETRPALAQPLADVLDVSQLKPALPERLRRVGPGPHPLGDLHLEVMRELLSRLAVQPAGVPHLVPPAPELLQHGNSAQVAFRIRVTAADTRSQSSTSAARRRRPAGVMR